MPKLLAISAAVIGDRSPRLLLPSVNRMTTLLLALESFRRETALASPIPIAVPSSISPRWAISVRTFCNRFSSEAWSVVIGHCVKASPANIDSPILSLGRPVINSAATCLAASIRLGFRSSASIDVETSIASMMSIPSIVWFFHEFWVCGRASTNTTNTKTAIRNKGWMGISTTFHERGA